MATIRGYRKFSEIDVIKKTIKNSKKYMNEDPLESEILNIFSTKKQRSWLILSNKRLYFILDDIRKPKPKVIRSLDKNELIFEKKVIVTLRFNENYSNSSGTVRFNDLPRGWLYSKRLFSSSSILKEKIENLIKKKMYT